MQELLGHVMVPPAGSSRPRHAHREGALPSVSFDRFYRDTWRFVWRSLARLGVPPSAVDDLFQEVFLVVHRRLPQYVAPDDKQEIAERVWVFQILRFVVRTHRRRFQRKGAALVPASADVETDLESVAAPTETPLALAERSERVRLLYELLACLDDDKREIFVLVELEELTVPDAASALGLNERTAYSRVSAARAEFRRAYDRHRAREDWRLK